RHSPFFLMPACHPLHIHSFPTRRSSDLVKTKLKKWRVSEFQPNEDRAGAYAISAERGYGRELANLIFHISLVAVLITVAFGRLVYYEGQVIVVTDTGSTDLEDRKSTRLN